MHPDWSTLGLDALPETLWSVLTEAVRPGAHPWRTPVLATRGHRGGEARVVVLRAVTLPGFELIAFSDVRAAKVVELEAHPEATWVFYDPAQQVQLRAFSEVRMHYRDPVAQTYWHRLPAEHQSRYGAGAAPGMPRLDPNSPAPAAVGDERQFAVLVGAVRALDILWIGGHPHRRAKFRRVRTRWTGSWVEP
ncbi:MAG: hypothetical protein J0L84_15785 [Verrucomicrobia bacterium]|nr:hypothetical protein [Verrucomicrobiota bacterium]